MKNNSTSTSTRASVFLKRIISVFWSMAKAKSIALRNKTEAMKCRITVLSLLKNKKFSLGSISHKIQAIMGQQQQHDKKKEEEEEDDQSRAIVLYNASAPSSSIHTQMEEEGEFEDQEKYPDLRHTLFEEEDDLDLGDPNGSVIDLVRNCKELGGEEDFKLEDEIDQVADLFILKFHKRMRMQKLESFKRYQEMLQRSL